MAFGIGKAFKKAWKGTVGKMEDSELIKGTAIAVTGGLAGLAAYGMYKGYQHQQKMINAQIASAERIAAMQNQPQIQASITPTAEIENAQIAEENLASSKRRAFMFANTVRGNGGTLSARKTLG